MLDTDHVSLYGRNQPMMVARLSATPVPLATTANVEEQLRGRLAQVAEAKADPKPAIADQRLVETVLLLSEFQMLPYNESSQADYQALKAQRLRMGTPDF